jgi:death-on-curing protein
VIYLKSDQLIEIHEKIIATTKGRPGIRDRGLIESIAIRPQWDQFSSVFEKATALAEAVAKWHPFIDGNKRTALTAVAVFLQMNGYFLLPREDTVESILNFSEGKMTFEDFSIWLQDCSIEV